MHENNSACIKMVVGALTMTDKSLRHELWANTWTVLPQNSMDMSKDVKMTGTIRNGIMGEPADGDVKSEQANKWSKIKQMTMYLRCLLCLELPDQVTLLSNTSVWTRAGVYLRSCWSRNTGGRSHAWFVLQTRFLLKLCLHKEKKGKRFII